MATNLPNRGYSLDYLNYDDQTLKELQAKFHNNFHNDDEIAAKCRGLKKYLDDEIDFDEIVTGDGRTFEVYNHEYLVLTDEEADETAADYIRESLWTFNTGVIIQYCSVLDYDDASFAVIRAIQEQCEGGNDAIAKLIDDLDVFVDDAIQNDSRGEFISWYDGREYEYYDENTGQWYYIYRMN